MSKKTQYIVKIIVLSLCLLLANYWILAGDRGGDRSWDKDTLVVGMELKFPPFETIDEQGNPIGVSVELAKQLGEKLGKTIIVEPLDWAGLIPALQSQRIDLIISSMGITEERMEAIDFSNEYATSSLGLAINKTVAGNTYEDLNQEGMIIAVKQGTTGEMWVRKNLPLAKVKPFTEVSAGLLDVNNGQSDAFIYDPLTLIESTKNMSNIKLNTEALPGTKGWGIGMRKGEEKLKEEINQALGEIRAGGFYEEMREKYLREDIEKYQSYGLDYFF